MTPRFTAAIVLVLVGMGAQAQTAATTTNPLTREQVRAEFFQARAEGRLPGFGESGSWPEPLPVGRALTRSEVLQELRVHGPVPTGEGAMSAPAPRTGTVVSRADVRAQAIHAMRAGALIGGER